MVVPGVKTHNGLNLLPLEIITQLTITSLIDMDIPLRGGILIHMEMEKIGLLGLGNSGDGLTITI